MRGPLRVICYGLAFLSQLSLARMLSAADEVQPASRAFFETHVRSILSTRCVKCHGPQKQESGLRLDSREAVLKGGEGGTVVVPGRPAESRLITAIGYGPDDVQMPPDGKIDDELIAMLTKWVQLGLPWSGDSLQPELSDDESPFNKPPPWSFRPLLNPSIPVVQRKDWPRTAVDNFLLARLEAAGASPAPPTDKRTLLRRLYLDLVGLPPSPEEMKEFLADDSPTAYEDVVDGLLASPRYGERWARHWLDLVRFAETLGLGYDFNIHHAWPYRDYVIRAFNDDVPYTQFVTEHIAGDLLAEPRRHPVEQFNESVIGTGFYWFGAGAVAPDDTREEECDRIDEQIDVMSRTFLGLAVSCARCHDHKHDPISLDDYYALAGFLKSTRRHHVDINRTDRTEAIVGDLRQLKTQQLRLSQEWFASVLGGPVREQPEVPLALLGLVNFVLAAVAVHASSQRKRRRRIVFLSFGSIGVLAIVGILFVPQFLESRSAENDRLKSQFLEQTSRKFAQTHQSLVDSRTEKEFSNKRDALVKRMKLQLRAAKREPKRAEVFEDFKKNSYDSWHVSGNAFGGRPSTHSDFTITQSLVGPSPYFVPASLAHSGLVSRQLQGALRSGDFQIDKKFVLFRMRRDSQILSRPADETPSGDVQVIVDGYFVDHFEGFLRLDVEASDQLAWYAIDVGRWKGHRAYIEIVDDDDDFIVVDKILFSDTPLGLHRERMTAVPNRPVVEMLDDPDITTLAQLEHKYYALLETTLEQWQRDEMGGSANADDSVKILNQLWAEGTTDESVGESTQLARIQQEIADLIDEYWQRESEISAPRLTVAAIDGTANDEFVLDRGDYTDPGETVPRAFLRALAGDEQPAIREGSGRLTLANRLTDHSNPLLPRVMVNRLWQHHFGRGIVSEPDNFGSMGAEPTDPELLDFLARRFIQSGYSLKHMHRLMVTSNAYRMSSQADHRRAAQQDDSQRVLLHRMSMRKLEAEVIRDTMLALGGSLDQKLYGPGVPPFIPASMDGQTAPADSGPTDGAGRRSIYITVRRMSLTPMLKAFHLPIPTTTVGRRRDSSTPDQALTLMNDPLVHQQAGLWARRLLSQNVSAPAARIAQLYEAALCRPPTEDETDRALAFLHEQKVEYDSSDELACWTDLCHVLMSSSEFLFAN